MTASARHFDEAAVREVLGSPLPILLVVDDADLRVPEALLHVSEVVQATVIAAVVGC